LVSEEISYCLKCIVLLRRGCAWSSPDAAESLTYLDNADIISGS
jgi:hypothetical protein